MKSRFIFILSLLCIGGLIGLWLAREKPPPEVIKIYKAAPYVPKSTRATAGEGTHSPTSVPVAETASTAYSDGIQTNEVLSEEDAEQMPEEDDFWEWLELLETELAGENLSEEREDVVEPETDTATEIPYPELARMVADIYDMESVLNEYGIYVDELGKSTCPKCARTDFVLIQSRIDGNNQWACMDCEWPGGGVTDFVAWMEGIDNIEATRYLAERAGLIK